MNTLVAVSTMIDITNAAATLLRQAQEISSVVAKAQSEGRDVTSEEMDSIIKMDDAAKIALNDAIMKHGG